jgi:hypothetical protein
VNRLAGMAWGECGYHLRSSCATRRGLEEAAGSGRTGARKAKGR